jgi:drug/metabolite transporter (DMT)-like permease
MLRVLAHPYALLALTALFWSGNAIAGKLAVGHVSPMVTTFLRWLIPCLILLPFAAGDLRRDWPVIRANLGVLAALGLLGFTLFNALFYVALHFTTAINVMIEQSSMPLVVFLANFLLFGTRANAWQIVGFCLTLVGVLLTAAHGDLATLLSLDLNFGDALMMGAVLVYGLYTVALRYKPPIHWRSTIYVLCFVACLASVPFLLAEAAMGRAEWPDGQGALVVLYIALFPSIAAQTLYIRGVEMIGANRANLFINLTPIFGAVLAMLVLGEELFPYHVAALFCVLGGIGLAERGRARGLPETTTPRRP